jgi:hypothetical protein
MASIKDLYTRDENNTPVRMTVGSQWIDVLGTDSDKFQKVKRKLNIDVIGGKIKPNEVEAHLIAALIVGWSFDEECNDANKLELLRNSPSLAEAIDRAASKRANFVGKLSAGSATTPSESSS